MRVPHILALSVAAAVGLAVGVLCFRTGSGGLPQYHCCCGLILLAVWAAPVTRGREITFALTAQLAMTAGLVGSSYVFHAIHYLSMEPWWWTFLSIRWPMFVVYTGLTAFGGWLVRKCRERASEVRTAAAPPAGP